MQSTAEECANAAACACGPLRILELVTLLRDNGDSMELYELETLGRLDTSPLLPHERVILQSIDDTPLQEIDLSSNVTLPAIVGWFVYFLQFLAPSSHSD